MKGYVSFLNQWPLRISSKSTVPSYIDFNLILFRKAIVELVWLRQLLVIAPFDDRNGVAFLKSLAVVAKRQSFGRAGLMCLTKCISSAACGIGQCSDVSPVILQDKDSYISDQVDLLDTFRYIIESSKQHFNPSYRHQGT